MSVGLIVVASLIVPTIAFAQAGPEVRRSYTGYGEGKLTSPR